MLDKSARSFSLNAESSCAEPNLSKCSNSSRNELVIVGEYKSNLMIVRKYRSAYDPNIPERAMKKTASNIVRSENRRRL